MGGPVVNVTNQCLSHPLKAAVLAAVFAAFAVGLSGCGGDGSESPTGNSLPADSGGTSGTGSGGSSGNGGSASGSAFTTFMGSSTLLVGAQMEDVTAAAAPFDARYVYLASNTVPEAACLTACPDSCTSWWGCWQDRSQPPGQYVKHHLQQNATVTWQGASRPRLPVFTYYTFLTGSGVVEGTNEVAAMNNAAVLGRYFDDWRFLLQTIGSERVMLHIEPDFWGFVRSVNNDPHAVPAQVKTANPADCASQEDSAAGMARCMIAMARKYAPQVAVGLHASPWNYLASGDGEATGRFLLALGAADGDFVATDPSDRDAGWYSAQGRDSWWNDQTFAAYLAWSKTLAETVGKPTVMWQVPLGNAAQDNTINHWQDNRVDYLFSRIDEVADAHVAALLFGAGHHEQTTPETDGGNLVRKTTANWQAGGARLR
jgi:hypothetical protein